MKTYFISSDIHSFFDAYAKALSDANFDINNPEHIVIACGDIFDRGDKSLEILSFFKRMKKEGRLIFIRGNHEDLFMDLVYKKHCEPEYHDFSNGTVRTLVDLSGYDIGDNTKEQLIIDALTDNGTFDLIDSAADYYETKNHIFVHGWIPSANHSRLYDPNWRQAGKHRWKEARWTNGMAGASRGILEPGKTIVCGHWHASYGNSRKNFPGKDDYSYHFLEFSDNELFKPYYNDGIIAIDACTSHTGFCNMLVMTEDEI